MVLDLWFADVAQTSLKNTPGGPKSRSESTASYDGDLDKMFDFSNLLYGPVTPARNNALLMLATSGYSPPAVVRSLALSTSRGSFEYVSRRPGVGSSGWNQNKDWEVDPTRSIVDYTYVTPDYVLGTAELNPADTRIGPSRQDRWQGVIFASSSADRVYPQLGLSGSDTQDAFVSVQRGNVLITRRNGASTQPTLVYFPQSLESLNEQGGWLFAKAGGGYLAVRPANGTYSWLDPAKNKAGSIANRFISLSDGSSPIIFETARTVAYPSLQAFELDITNNARSYTGGFLNYTGSDGTTFWMGGPAGTPKVNNVPITYAPTKLFNSPYMQSTFGSGIVTITFGAQRAIYNFSNSSNPVKTLS
jgi:hypothetical protein